MGKELKLGDRVAYYMFNGRSTGRIYEVINAELFKIKDDHDGYPQVHPKQCRRLKRKERRRVWVLFDSSGTPGNVTGYKPVNVGWREFIESRPARRKESK